jgi:hypothetical protein
VEGIDVDADERGAARVLRRRLGDAAELGVIEDTKNRTTSTSVVPPMMRSCVVTMTPATSIGGNENTGGIG